MVRRSWILLTGAVFMGVTALVSVTACAQAQEDARAQEAEAPEAEPRFRVAIGGGSYLGVYLSDVDTEDVSELDLGAERGARVDKVADDSPAADAGLEADDVIVSWNDAPIESVAQLTRMVRETPAGRTVSLGIVRDGRERAIEVTVSERSSRALAYSFGPEVKRAREAYGRALDRVEGLRYRFDTDGIHGLLIARPRLGVSLQSLTPQLAEFFGIEEGEGALVSAVREDSPAEKAGLRAGDVIVAIAGETVEGPGDVMRAIADHDEGEVQVTVVRDKKRRTMTATLEKPEEVEWQGSGSRIWASPGAEAVRIGVPRVIVVPEIADVDMQGVVIPEAPDVRVRTIPAPAPIRATPVAPVQKLSWEELAPTAL